MAMELAQALGPGQQIISSYTSKTLNKTMYELYYRTKSSGRLVRVVGHSVNQCKRALKCRLAQP